MQAIILAAGMGKRLKELTADNAKCMVKVNNTALIERLLRQLENKGLTKIVVVVGYKADLLTDYINSLGCKVKIEFVENSIFDQTNNIYSLALAKHYLTEDDTLLFESDLIFEEDLITQLLQDDRDTLAVVDKYDDWMDGTCLKLSDADEITQFIPGTEFDEKEKASYFKTVNVYKFNKTFSEKLYVPYLDDFIEKHGANQYYEKVLAEIIKLDNPMIKAKRLSGQRWYEIDNAADLAVAENMFKE